MKMQTIFKLLIVLLIVSSCSSDDNGDSVFVLNSENFSGNYRMNSFNEVAHDVYIVNGNETNVKTTLVGDSFEGSYMFNDDGTFIMNAQYNVNETIVEDNNPPQVDDYLQEDNYSGTYTINAANETISLTFIMGEFEDTSTYDIVDFTSNSFKILYTDENNNPADGNTYVLEGEIGLVRL